MMLRQQLQLQTTAAVCFTGVLVSGAWLLPLEGVGRGMAVVAAVVGGLAVTHWGMRRLLEPVFDEADHLVRAIQTLELTAAEDHITLAVDVLRPVGQAVDRLRGRYLDQVEAMRRRAEGARYALEASSLGILLVDDEGLIRYVNPSLGQLITLRRDPVGRRPIEVVPLVEVHEAVETARQHGEAEEVTCAAGALDLTVRAQRLGDDSVIVRGRDITGARETERARSDFVANVSHELRTPLSAIMGYTETILLDAERIPDDILPLLHTVDRNVRRLRDLFEDLLRLHRIESRRRELPVERVALRPILEAAMGTAMDQASASGLSVSLVCEPEVEGLVNVEALGAIVGNLVGNACAYTPEGGRVVVRVSEREGRTLVEVEDDGLGIDPMHHERIFERFFRVDEARSRRKGGTGLGLAIVKHFARASGCLLELRSERGVGSVFSLTLPEG